MDITPELVADPFAPYDAEAAGDTFEALTRRPSRSAPPPSMPVGVCVGVFLGFDLLDQPLVGNNPALPGEVVPAQSIVALRHDMIGAEIAISSNNGHWSRPIILGVINARSVSTRNGHEAAASLTAVVDGQRTVIEAQQEVVLKCGDASITLTRAGKIMLKGHYILSQSSGYNKIKGAAIDIN